MDFGSQDEFPTHPELLDWLAVDFVEHGWDRKRTIKQILMSATYRQSSVMTPALASADPENLLLARGPRFRLQGEFIRDTALAVSGLRCDRDMYVVRDRRRVLPPPARLFLAFLEASPIPAP